jgi:hypothetical protein
MSTNERPMPQHPTNEGHVELGNASTDLLAAITELKAMVQTQKFELEELRIKATAPTDVKSKGAESEAKDLLRKIRFDGSHFSSFKVKFLNVCRLRHVTEILERTEAPPHPDAAEVEAFAYDDRVNIAKLYLQAVLTDEVFDLVRDDDHPAEMWKSLVSHYETKEWSNKIYTQRRLYRLEYDAGLPMMKHISKIKAMVRELTEMGKTFTEQDTVDLIFTSLPDAGPDNWNSIINNLRPSPNHEVKLKTVVSTLLDEEEKRRERTRHRRNDTRRDFRRQDGRRHQRREEQHRDQLDRDRKRPHVDDPSDPNKVEVNAVDTKSAKYHGRGPEGDGLKYCFICKTRGNHVGQDHDDYDPNYRKKSGRQVTKISIKKPRTRRDTDSDTETDINVNAVATTTDTKQPLLKDSHWTLDNGATGHVTGSRSAITSWHGATNLVLPDGPRIAAKMGSAKIRLTKDGPRRRSSFMMSRTTPASTRTCCRTHAFSRAATTCTAKTPSKPSMSTTQLVMSSDSRCPTTCTYLMAPWHVGQQQPLTQWPARPGCAPPLKRHVRQRRPSAQRRRRDRRTISSGSGTAS